MLGPNGTGKTSLIRILLGLLEPSAGRVLVNGGPPREGRQHVGYVPQQRAFDRDLALRARDLVRLGLDGHRWGIGRLDARDVRASTARSRASVRATTPTRRSAGSRAASSSGCGSRRRSSRIRRLLLADEPLLSLDLAYQHTITGLLDERRRTRGDAGPLRHARHQSGPRDWSTGALPRAGRLGDRGAGRGAHLRDALAALRHGRRRPARARPRSSSSGRRTTSTSTTSTTSTDVHRPARPALRAHRAPRRRGRRGRLRRDRDLRRHARRELRRARDLGARLHRRRRRARDRASTR